MTHTLLVGNPNCGKTTLFNALTGADQCVGNWPGVTVEKKTGSYALFNQIIEITDLPGVYSLTSSVDDCSQDEQIAARAIVALHADLIINVVDACHLERHLYLTSQILELGKPVIIVLNMMDIAKQQGICIDTKALAEQLGCPVIPIQAHKKIGIVELNRALTQVPAVPPALELNLSPAIKKSLLALEQRILAHNPDPRLASYYARRIVEGDNTLFAEDLMSAFQITLQEDSELDVLFADARYQKLHQIVASVQKKHSDISEDFTVKLDRLVLHRYWALPIFFLMMYLMFFFAINIGGALQDFFDITTDAIFVQGSAWLLTQMHASTWLIALIAHGIGKGINTTLTFIPVIAAMFFFLSLLEASGYMARAAFVVDKLMRVLGLPGKSFVPMIVGFGCNVPAVMAARTLDSPQERLLTVLMSPFMSCSARLAIYAVFVAAFFPSGGQNVVFSLYLIGIVMAVLTGFILRRTTLGGKVSPLILELPTYHKPALRRLFKETFLRLRLFIVRAGRLIIPLCLILGGLNTLTIHAGIHSGESVLAWLGQGLTPLFAPMGLEQDNWPATVGLLTGMLSKEVVIGSLNSLYTQLGNFGEASVTSFDFGAALQKALWSIPLNLAQLGQALSNPLAASAPEAAMSGSVYGIMVERFDGRVGAYAYLLFILLYVPCVSTVAVIRQEAGRKLMWFSIIWSFIIAYTVAVLFYQLMTFSTHPQQSIFWTLATLFCASLAVGFLYYQKAVRGGNYVSTNP